MCQINADGERELTCMEFPSQAIILEDVETDNGVIRLIGFDRYGSNAIDYSVSFESYVNCAYDVFRSYRDRKDAEYHFNKLVTG